MVSVTLRNVYDRRLWVTMSSFISSNYMACPTIRSEISYVIIKATLWISKYEKMKDASYFLCMVIKVP